MTDERELKVRITGDSKALTGSVKAAKDAVDDLSKSTRDGLGKALPTVRDTSEHFRQLEANLDPTVANSRRLAAATDLLDRELRQGNITVERHAQLMALVNQRYTQGRSGMINMRMASQQLGYQVQDMAVQLQMGVNPIMALTQQGSQLVSIMGPGGALLGAVLAIGGAIAGAFVPSMARASEEVDGFNRRLDDMLAKTRTMEIHQATMDLAEAERALAQAGMDFNAAMSAAIVAPWADEGPKSEKQLRQLQDDARRRVLAMGELVTDLRANLARLTGGEGDGGNNATRGFEASLQSLMDTLFPAEAAARRYEASVTLLQQAIVQFPAQAALYRRALDLLQSGHRQVGDSLDDLRADIEGFNGTLTGSLDLAGQYMADNAAEFYRRMEDEFIEHQHRINHAGQSTARAFEDAWVSALRGSEDLWKNFADSVIDQILRIQYQMSIGQGVENMMRGLFSGLFTAPGLPTGSGGGGGGSYEGVVVPPSNFDGMDLDLGLRPSAAARPLAAPTPASVVQVTNINDFSSVSSADELRIRQMLDENSRQTEARIIQNMNRGGAAARASGRR